MTQFHWCFILEFLQWHYLAISLDAHMKNIFGLPELSIVKPHVWITGSEELQWKWIAVQVRCWYTDGRQAYQHIASSASCEKVFQSVIFPFNRFKSRSCLVFFVLFKFLSVLEVSLCSWNFLVLMKLLYALEIRDSFIENGWTWMQLLSIVFFIQKSSSHL